MNSLLFKHQMAFSILAFCSTLFFLLHPPASKNLEITIALVLFFGLGIPHGALDYALGKHLFNGQGSSFWQFRFLGAYFIAITFVVVFWFSFPFAAFLLFLVLSALHFGFSDIKLKKTPRSILEGLSRGILPLSAPAYFYSENFQEIIESSLSSDQAAMITIFLASLFLPCLLLFISLIAWGLWERNCSSFANSLELLALLVLFIALIPFAAFIIYFCFLHSIRHILCVLDELDLPTNFQSVKWVILQALPTTLLTFFALLLSYLYLKESQIDLITMFNLFFLSLAALTFPHMLIVGLVKFKSKCSKKLD